MANKPILKTCVNLEVIWRPNDEIFDNQSVVSIDALTSSEAFNSNKVIPHYASFDVPSRNFGTPTLNVGHINQNVNPLFIFIGR